MNDEEDRILDSFLCQAIIATAAAFAIIFLVLGVLR